MTEETKQTIAHLLGYICITNPTQARQILSGNFSIPSLDGKGKMSKSRGGQTVINLADDLQTIQKKVAKIPSNKENWHVFVKLFWSVIGEKEREEIANMATVNILKTIS